MAHIIDNFGLTFDDVLLIPRHSPFGSRFGGEISLETSLFRGFNLRYPIISANMDSVTGGQMALAMEKLGGLGIVHRFMPSDIHRTELSNLKRPIACIGVGKDGIDRLERLLDGDSRPWAVLIDIAHGDSSEMLVQIKNIKSQHNDLPIIAGNVATGEGALRLWKAGADCVKVGVGPGSLCSTRIQTGCGIPQLTAIMDVASVVPQGKTLIADGGIRSSGDALKALASGANAIMVGQIFAGTNESPGERYRDRNGQVLKRYRGMASKEAQESWKGFATSVEGEATYVPYRGSVEEIFTSMINGLLSGMSYQGAKNLDELRQHAEFIRQTSGGLREGMPHALN